MQRPRWAPDDVDMDSPSPERVYDALLGGSHDAVAFFGDVALVPPGLVDVSAWRPDPVGHEARRTAGTPYLAGVVRRV
jgi:hypothetical protein